MTFGPHTTPAILKWCALALLRVNSGDWKHPKFRTPPSILYEQVPIISLAFGQATCSVSSEGAPACGRHARKDLSPNKVFPHNSSAFRRYPGAPKAYLQQTRPQTSLR